MDKIKVEPRTLKGFRDFLPKEARKRQYVIETLRKVFESYGFEPLETPALEYEDILMGKYGEEGDKLMYRFEDNGQRRVAMRYDQTVPLARVVAQFQNNLPFPFKRYQIQNVWRAENTQKGRFREFLQCDMDTVGSSSALADAEIIACASTCLRALGFNDYKILVNDRSIFREVSNITVGAIDKLNKIGEKGVIEELVTRGEYDTYQKAEEAILQIRQTTPTEWINQVIDNAISLGVLEDEILFAPTLARGLDYYTSTIVEVEIDGYDAGSVGGGGRYDKLAGLFSSQDIPSVGFAFGFDRLTEAMEEKGLFAKDMQTSYALVAVTTDTKQLANETVSRLRAKGTNSEVYLDENAPFEKQFKYAEKKEIPYVVIPINETEAELRSKNEDGTISKETLSLDSLVDKLK